MMKTRNIFKLFSAGLLMSSLPFISAAEQQTALSLAEAGSGEVVGAPDMNFGTGETRLKAALGDIRTKIIAEQLSPGAVITSPAVDPANDGLPTIPYVRGYRVAYGCEDKGHDMGDFTTFPHGPQILISFKRTYQLDAVGDADWSYCQFAPTSEDLSTFVCTCETGAGPGNSSGPTVVNNSLKLSNNLNNHLADDVPGPDYTCEMAFGDRSNYIDLTEERRATTWPLYSVFNNGTPTNNTWEAECNTN
jgi:hypothetical protein